MVTARTPVNIGGIMVGDGYPPVFLAEIGTYFNQDMKVADEMVRRIHEARQKEPTIPVILKGEILHDRNVCLDDATIETYQSKRGIRKQERYRDLIERKIVGIQKYRKLFALSHGYGLRLIVSVYDCDGADFAKDVGAVALKIASGNITHIPLIRHAASLGLPMLIDTGRASLAEVDTAVRAARTAGCRQLVIEHSPDGHPAPPENHNMRLLHTYAQAFGVPIGLSDHHNGEEMLYLAVGLGAHLLEKGLSLDAEVLEQDHAHALFMGDLSRVLGRVRNCWIALGNGFRDLANTSGLIATSTRMGLVAKRPLRKGALISLENVRFAFPCRGIGVQHFDQVSGWIVNKDLPEGSVIRWQDVRPPSS
jgi:sialic acid synthase SpsE